MTPSEEAARNLRAEMERQRVSSRELARRVGMPAAPAWRRVTARQTLTVDDLCHFAEALGVPAASLLPAELREAA